MQAHTPIPQQATCLPPLTIAEHRTNAATGITPARLAELEAGAAPTSYAECVAANASDWRRKRERIAAGESPFAVHRDAILQCHSTALRLQAVVLNLYNDGHWAKKAPVYLSSLIANADDEHIEILIDLQRGYARCGEADPDFLALGRLLAEQRLPKSRRAA